MHPPTLVSRSAGASKDSTNIFSSIGALEMAMSVCRLVGLSVGRFV